MRRISATPLSRETIERYRATPRPNAPDSYARAFKGEDVVTYSLLRELCPSSCRERTLVAQIMSAPKVPRLDPEPRNIWLADSRGGNSNRRSLSSSCRHRPRFAGSGRKSLPRTVNGTGHTGPKTTLPRSTISTRPWRRSRTRNGSRTRPQRELRTNCEPREPRAAPAKTPPP